MSFSHNKSYLEEHIKNHIKEFSKPEHRFNFSGIIDSASVVFMGRVDLQYELNDRIRLFEELFHIHLGEAENKIEAVRSGVYRGVVRLKYFDEDEGFVKVPMPITAMENHLKALRNWCNKQIAIISSDLGLEFENIEDFELESAG